MTADEAGACWPAVAAAVSRYLLSRGARPEQCEDLVQETALKALTSPGPVRSLEAWSIRTAHNAWVDLVRKEAGRCLPLEQLPEQRAVVPDIGEAHLERDRLHRTVLAVQALPASERSLLVAAVDGTAPPLPRKEAVTRNVRLHRLRKRLLAQVGAVAAAFGASTWRGGARSAPLPLATAAGLVPVALALSLLLPSGAPAPASPERGRTVPADAQLAGADQPGDTGPTTAGVVAARGGDGRPVVAKDEPAPRGRPVPALVVPTQQEAVEAPAVAVTIEEQEGDVLVCVQAVPVLGGTCLPDPVAEAGHPAS